MTLKDKMKTYNFWISLVSAVLLLVRIIGDKYGFVVDAGLVMDITTGVCGIFVILGIISAPQKNQVVDTKGDNIMNQNNAHSGINDDAVNTSNIAVGRFQNVLAAMKEKMQNNTNSNEKDAIKLQNAEKNNEEIGRSVGGILIDDRDHVSGEVVHCGGNIEDESLAIDIQSKAEAVDSEVRPCVEVAKVDVQQNVPDSLIEVEDVVVENNKTVNDFVDNDLIQESLECDKLDVAPQINSIETMIAELSAEERAELARMLLNV